jgi:tetratricopeptide (TPR) repeat protein
MGGRLAVAGSLLALLAAAWAGRALSRAQEWNSEVTLFRADDAGCPNSARTSSRLANIAYNEGDMVLAESLYQRALNVSFVPGDNWFPYKMIAGIRLNASDVTGALPYLETATRLAPYEDELFFTHGIALAKLGDHLGAVRRYRRALEISRKPHFFHELATSQVALKQHDDALATLDACEAAIRARALDPAALQEELLRLQRRKSAILTEAGRIDAAIASAEERLRGLDRGSLAHISLAAEVDKLKREQSREKAKKKAEEFMNRKKKQN